MIDVLYPTQLTANNQVTKLQFDYERGLIYFIDNSTLYAKKVDSRLNQVKLFKFENDVKILSFSYDWMARNFYITTTSGTTDRFFVVHFPYNKKGIHFTKTLFEQSKIPGGNLYDDIVVDPLRGFIWLSNDHAKLRRINSDGSGDWKTVAYENTKHYPTYGMGYDIDNHMVYWFNNQSKDLGIWNATFLTSNL